MTLYIINKMENINDMSKKNEKIKIFEIQGNIGVGKTTFLENIASDEFFKNVSIFIPEPVDEWKKITDEDGINLLQNFYMNMKRYSYTFQNGAYITKVLDVINAMNSRKKNIFLDRSVQTDMNVFAKMLYEDSINKSKDEKLINKMEWDLYNKWNNLYESYIIKDVERKIIYLRCEPLVAFERIKKRGRVEESGITLEYLTKLHEYHEKWIENEIKKGSFVIVLEWNENMSEREIYEKARKEIIQIM